MTSTYLFSLIGGLAALSIFLFTVMTVLKSKQAGNKKARQEVESIHAKLSEDGG